MTVSSMARLGHSEIYEPVRGVGAARRQWGVRGGGRLHGESTAAAARTARAALCCLCCVCLSAAACSCRCSCQSPRITGRSFIEPVALQHCFFNGDGGGPLRGQSCAVFVLGGAAATTPSPDVLGLGADATQHAGRVAYSLVQHAAAKETAPVARVMSLRGFTRQGLAVAGESRLTAAVPVDNPYCSCKSHGLQMQSLWIIPTVAVS